MSIDNQPYERRRADTKRKHFFIFFYRQWTAVNGSQCKFQMFRSVGAVESIDQNVLIKVVHRNEVIIVIVVVEDGLNLTQTVEQNRVHYEDWRNSEDDV